MYDLFIYSSTLQFYNEAWFQRTFRALDSNNRGYLYKDEILCLIKI